MDASALQPYHQSSTTRQKVMRFLAHLICIGMLFILPEILSSMGKPFRTVPELRWGAYAKSAIYVGVFYINYFFIVGSSFKSKISWWKLIGYNLLVVAAAFVLFWLISRWMHPYWDEAWRIRREARGLPPVAPRPPKDMGFLHLLKDYIRDFVMLVLTIGLSTALKLSDIWVNMERRARQLQDDRRREELANLKSQLNPHFLFNTLNSIYALIAVSPDKAQESVHELSRMLRYVLYEDAPQVPLQRELDFVDNYIKLMQLRLGPSTHFKCHIDAGSYSEATIAQLIFIPLIENAFKHGNTGESTAFIHISIHASDGKVTCVTSNSFHPLPGETPTTSRDDKQGGNLPGNLPENYPGKDSGVSGENVSGGIGIANLRRRLQLIYGDRATLDILRKDGVFTATLTVPLGAI